MLWGTYSRLKKAWKRILTTQIHRSWQSRRQNPHRSSLLPGFHFNHTAASWASKSLTATPLYLLAPNTCDCRRGIIDTEKRILIPAILPLGPESPSVHTQNTLLSSQVCTGEALITACWTQIGLLKATVLISAPTGWHFFLLLWITCDPDWYCHIYLVSQTDGTTYGGNTAPATPN